jgi:hypothetical protein
MKISGFRLFVVDGGNVAISVLRSTFLADPGFIATQLMVIFNIVHLCGIVSRSGQSRFYVPHQLIGAGDENHPFRAVDAPGNSITSPVNIYDLTIHGDGIGT